MKAFLIYGPSRKKEVEKKLVEGKVAETKYPLLVVRGNSIEEVKDKTGAKKIHKTADGKTVLLEFVCPFNPSLEENYHFQIGQVKIKFPTTRPPNLFLHVEEIPCLE